MKEDEKKVYFPNLDGIRFLAIALIIVHHIEQIKDIYGLDNAWGYSAIRNLGSVGVTLFFVLSGFLITYLLLYEKKETGKIDVKKFHTRRVLRIFPLYYLVVALGFLVLPLILMVPGFPIEFTSTNFIKTLLLFLLLLPNLAVVLVVYVPFITHLWAIGSLEQFYLLWPTVIEKVKRNLFGVLLFVIAIFVVLRNLPFLLYGHGYTYEPLVTMGYFFTHFRVDCMAIGALGALILFSNDRRFLDILYRTEVQVIVLVVTVLCVVIGLDIRYVSFDVYSLLFIILILNAAANPKTILKLENPSLNYLGRVSYGIYLFHPLAIFMLLEVFNGISTGDGMVSNVLLYILVFTLSIVLAVVSYQFYEQRFLKKKKEYTVINSGDERV